MQIFTSPFGNLARFRLETWQVFVWELGTISFGNLAKKHLFPKLSSSLLLLSLQIKHKCVILTLENLKEYERIITAWG